MPVRTLSSQSCVEHVQLETSRISPLWWIGAAYLCTEACLGQLVSRRPHRLAGSLGLAERSQSHLLLLLVRIGSMLLLAPASVLDAPLMDS